MPSQSLSPAIKKHQILLVVMDKSSYHATFKKIVKALVAGKETTCLVSLNRPLATIRSSLAADKIDPGRFFIIDAITSNDGGPSEDENSILVGNPKALTEMAMAMTRVMEEGKASHFVFDAVSTLMVYHPSNVVLMFCHNEINKMRSQGMKAVLLAVEDEGNSSLIKDLTMFSDQILEFKK